MPAKKFKTIKLAILQNLFVIKTSALQPAADCHGIGISYTHNYLLWTCNRKPGNCIFACIIDSDRLVNPLPGNNNLNII
jgi:hypothetical protein